MVLNLTLVQYLLIFLSTISCDVTRDKRARRKNDYGDKSLWKEEYEDELTKAMLSSKKRENVTRVAQSPSVADNDAVVEKLIDSLTTTEKYIKKIESIDFRLNRLDIEVHEKTNTIINQLGEISKAVRIDPTSVNKLNSHVDGIRSDIAQIKIMLEKSPRASSGVKSDGPEYRDSTLDSRLANVEGNMKTIMAGVDSIVNIISEVKNRQFSNRAFTKPERTETGASPVDTLSIINEFRRTLHEQRMRKNDCNYRSSRVERAERYPTDCFEIQMQGFNVSGIYKIKPEDMEPFYVLCDLNSAGGGWTVFQNRYDGSQDFYKSWIDYKYGFGNLAGEFWLGLDKIHYLTNQKLYEMRVEVETQHGQEAYAVYSVFTVGPEHEGFRISTLGTYYGTAGDSLTYHAGQKFSTPDMDNDEWKDGSCASEHGGAWWYKECDKSNLNGKYSTTTEENRGQSIYWISFKGPNFPLTKTKMMIRPLPASKPVDYIDMSRKPTGGRIRPAADKKGARKNDIKQPYDAGLGHNHPQYRYEDAVNADAFFPSYT